MVLPVECNLDQHEHLTSDISEHWAKKCGDISVVTSGGRAEIDNLKNDRS